MSATRKGCRTTISLPRSLMDRIARARAAGLTVNVSAAAAHGIRQMLAVIEPAIETLEEQNEEQP